MEKNKKTKWLFVGAIGLIIVIILLGVTMAMLTWTSTNTNINVTTLGLDSYIHYVKGTDKLTGTKLSPSVDYTGGVSTEIELWKNTSSKDIYGHLYLDVTTIGTNLATEPALKWVLTSNNIILSQGDFVGKKAGDRIALKENIALSSTKQTFKVYIWLDGNDQFNLNDAISGETISTLVKAEATDQAPPPSVLTLTKLGLTAKTGIPDFNVVATTDEGIYSALDDYGISYYFRGAVTNNYVKFAGFYWRIIRINGDGSIRMIYDGTSAHANGESSTDRRISETSFNPTYGDNAYVGYMMGIDNACANTTQCSGRTKTSSYRQATSNMYDSNIKKVIDNWHKTNIEDKGYSSKLSDVIYCNDRSLSSGTGIGTTDTLYKATERLSTNKAPILTCPQQNDAFTVNDTSKGNGALTYPVGLITADEEAMAGGKEGVPNLSYYLYTGMGDWTMSPYGFTSGNAVGWNVYSAGYLGISNVANYIDIRPVLSLQSSVTFTGTGTMSDPFVVS